MNEIAKKIVESRKSKGLSQEELAELSKVNLRTIQRIENNENEPRGKTLILVCDALDLNVEELQALQISSKLEFKDLLINGLFIIILNIILNSIIGLLMLDSESNINSKMGGFLLSFFIPFYICYNTQKLSGMNRMLKYGGGFIVYLLMSFLIIGLPKSIYTGLAPCLLFSLATLYYGNFFLNTKQNQ